MKSKFTQRIMNYIIASQLLTTQMIFAAPSKTRVDVANHSMSFGLQNSDSKILIRKPGAGRANAAQQLMNVLESKSIIRISEPSTQEDGPKGLWVQGANWSIDVRDDGNWIRFRGAAALPETRPLSQKPSSMEIEEMARHFLETTLSNFTELKDGERLEFLGTRFSYYASQSNYDNSTPVPDVTAWAAIFGRSVDNELIVGGGSTVAILFNAAGVVEGFDIDWPTYEALPSYRQKNLDVYSIKGRSQLLQGTPASNSTRQKVRFECGYFDPGGKSRRRITLVQAGCVEQVIETSSFNGKTMRSGKVHITPALQNPIIDSAWNELSEFCSSNPQQCQTPASHSK